MVGNLYGKAWLSVAVLFLCALVNGCDVTIPGPLYPTVEAANQASDFFQELCTNDDWPDEAASFLAYVQNLEEVETAELKDDGTCAIQYRSGVLHFFHCGLKEEETDDTDAPTESLLTAKSDSVVASSIPHVPGRTYPPATAAFYPHGGRIGQDIRSSCQQILEAFEKVGYDISECLSDDSYTPQEPTLDWVQHWNEQGIIYLNGHGGTHTLSADPEDPDPSPLAGHSFNYCFTNTQFEGAAGEDNPYEEDIQAHRLEFGTGGFARTLAVTPLYFTHNFESLPNSIIYLDTCHSLDTVVDVSLADTLIDLGAEMVLGWDDRVERRRASQTAALFFDRLCGLSQVDAASLIPPTRPFTAQQVFEYLGDRGRTSQSRANLSYAPQSETDTVTAACPVISNGFYLVAEPLRAGVENPSITLSGYFGPDQGEVLFNNEPLPQILLWEEERIVAYLPNDNITGDIKVRVNNLESNPMRLWGFSGSTTWNVYEAGKYNGTISATFEGRVLLQLMRSEVDGDPETATGPFDNCWYASERGQMQWDISGEWTDDDGNHHSLQAQGNEPIAPQYLVSTGTPGMLCMIIFELDPNVANATYKLELAAGVTGTDTVTELEGAVREEPWFRGCGTPYSETNPLPSNWVIPAGNYSETDFKINWTEISPDTTPPLPTDPDYAYPA